MSLKLVFLGRLEDAAGVAERDVPFVPALSDVLAGLDSELSEALSGARIKLAVNGKLVAGHDLPMLADGDELAFLPPVSGG